jgi:hypothetical protein
MPSPSKHTGKRKPPTLAELDEQIVALQKKRTATDRQMRDRFCQILDQSGLIEVCSDETKLEAMLKEIAGRFHRATVKTGDPNQPASAS